MLLGMRLAGFRRIMGGVRRMSVGHLCVVRCLLVIASLVVFSRLLVVLRRSLVMCRGGRVMFGCFRLRSHRMLLGWTSRVNPKTVLHDDQ
jgi:hypothetical protein